MILIASNRPNPQSIADVIGYATELAAAIRPFLPVDGRPAQATLPGFQTGMAYRLVRFRSGKLHTYCDRMIFGIPGPREVRIDDDGDTYIDEDGLEPESLGPHEVEQGIRWLHSLGRLVENGVTFRGTNLDLGPIDTAISEAIKPLKAWVEENAPKPNPFSVWESQPTSEVKGPRRVIVSRLDGTAANFDLNRATKFSGKGGFDPTTEFQWGTDLYRTASGKWVIATEYVVQAMICGPEEIPPPDEYREITLEQATQWFIEDHAPDDGEPPVPPEIQAKLDAMDIDASPSPQEGDATPAKSGSPPITKSAAALAMFLENPELTDREIASRVGCAASLVSKAVGKKRRFYQGHNMPPAGNREDVGFAG